MKDELRIKTVIDLRTKYVVPYSFLMVNFTTY